MRRLAAPALALALALLACDPGPPTGQVLARVDGVDVTRRDVLVELESESGATDGDGANADAMRRQLLDRVIERRLLAAEARRDLIDRSPEFLGQERRSRELILGEQLMRRLGGRLPPPSREDVSRYVALREPAFSGRQSLGLRRIVTDRRIDRSAIARLPDIAAIAAWLTARGIRYRRSDLLIDSLLAPADQVTALEASKGRPIVTEAGSDLLVDQLVSRSANPVPPAERRRLATLMLEQARFPTLRARTLNELRSRAAITYATDTAEAPGPTGR